MIRSPAQPPNGLELSCPAAQATVQPFSHILTGKAPSAFRTPAGSAAASCWAAMRLSMHGKTRYAGEVTVVPACEARETV